MSSKQDRRSWFKVRQQAPKPFSPGQAPLSPSSTLFDDHRDVKQELKRSVLWPLRLPHLFKGYRQPPKTFLLVGPPGKYKVVLVSGRQGRPVAIESTLAS